MQNISKKSKEILFFCGKVFFVCALCSFSVFLFGSSTFILFAFSFRFLLNLFLFSLLSLFIFEL
ncbi:hypothetical protein LEP1GSC172_2444 [Leptospira noguchii]|uniref:Uncharacterized protein n=1 Tax=Leptospira noguchii TaxID=28182 RepID=M6VEP8_9LEPT|nr:hypothetical protein LEP1GSC172_2444 [Leptospira noguchii]